MLSLYRHRYAFFISCYTTSHLRTLRMAVLRYELVARYINNFALFLTVTSLNHLRMNCNRFPVVIQWYTTRNRPEQAPFVYSAMRMPSFRGTCSRPFYLSYTGTFCCC